MTHGCFFNAGTTTMSIKSMMQDPKIGGTVAAVLLITAVTLILTQKGDSRGFVVTGAYYYDLNTKKLFDGPREELLPIDAPSGPLQAAEPADIGKKAGVKAYVYSCGECKEGEWFIGLLEYYPESVWSLKDSETEYDKFSEARKIAAPDGPWIQANSEEGKKLNDQRIFMNCKQPKLCTPGKID